MKTIDQLNSDLNMLRATLESIRQWDIVIAREKTKLLDEILETRREITALQKGQMNITAEYFEQATGHPPQGDDLYRANCSQAGELGHYHCG